MKQQQMVATVTLYQALGGGWRSTGLQPADGISLKPPAGVGTKFPGGTDPDHEPNKPKPNKPKPNKPKPNKQVKQ